MKNPLKNNEIKEGFLCPIVHNMEFTYGPSKVSKAIRTSCITYSKTTKQLLQSKQCRLSLPTYQSPIFLFTLFGVYKRKRFALDTTVMEDKDIAAPAMIGLSNHPVNGNNNPAAMGIPNEL